MLSLVLAEIQRVSEVSASVRGMLSTLLIALAAAIVAAILLAVLERPRKWIVREARRIWLAISPRQHEQTRLAIERIAAVLTERICYDEGNPDDEYRDDWYRWLTGEPDANVDYSRKQQRDLERLRSGDFLPGR
jgi:hypothetical protein